jgi:hypothetical protein
MWFDSPGYSFHTCFNRGGGQCVRSLRRHPHLTYPPRSWYPKRSLSWILDLVSWLRREDHKNTTHTHTRLNGAKRLLVVIGNDLVVQKQNHKKKRSFTTMNESNEFVSYIRRRYWVISPKHSREFQVD